LQTAQSGLVDFIKKIDSNVSFCHGRKFSYEKSGEKISYNQLVSQIHSRVQESKSIKGYVIAKELRQLNSNANKQLSSANISVRIATHVKRF
jgi:hypothetical protein